MKLDYFTIGDKIPFKGVYRLRARDRDELFLMVESAQRLCISLSNVDDKTTLIRLLKTQVPLPDYCGENWDALAECLAESVTRPVILFSDVLKIRTTNKGSYVTFISILFQELSSKHLVLLCDDSLT